MERSKLQLEAITLLGLTPEQVDAQPLITPVLRKVKILEDVPEYLRISDEPDARCFMGVFDGLPKNRRRDAPLEAVAIAAGLTTTRLFELIAGAVFTQSRYEAALLAAASHPKVVAKSIEKALEEPLKIEREDGSVAWLPAKSGLADRKMLHLQAGFIPVPKTQIVSLPGVKSIDARTQTAVSILPAVESSVQRLADRLGERLLEAPSDRPEIVESEDDEETEDEM